jgi:hypothetical protein
MILFLGIWSQVCFQTSCWMHHGPPNTFQKSICWGQLAPQELTGSFWHLGEGLGPLLFSSHSLNLEFSLLTSKKSFGSSRPGN